MEKSKLCIICREDKVLSAYYKHPQMGDGHLNKCKECCKSQAKKRHHELCQDENYVWSERERGRDKYHRLEYREKYRPDFEGRKKAIETYNDKFPEKLRARSLSGSIKVAKGIHKHHWSYKTEYSKDIIEIDEKEHALLHRYLIYSQEEMLYRVAIDMKPFKKNELLDSKEKHLRFYNLITQSF
jgi:hypothetical protein